jgi:serine/threonine protein kinase
MADQIGQYRLIERIAAGGMGEVFKAKLVREAGFEKTVAVKRMLPHLSKSPDFESRFCAEARVSARLNHANIVHIYDFGTQNDVLFLAMEFIDGVDLGSLLARVAERGERLPLAHALEICTQVLRGLDYAHRMVDDDGRTLKLIHRDISPGNILISVEGEVKLTDFGLAHARQDREDDLLVGKLPYLPPEQVAGEPLDRRSDLYSLGLVLYEMLYGRKAFPDALPKDALLRAIAAGAFDILPKDGLPEAVLDVVRHATAMQKSDRYSGARDMLTDVERLRDQAKRENDEPLAGLIGRLFADRASVRHAAPEKTMLAPRPISQTPAPEESLLAAPESQATTSRSTRLWVWSALLALTVIIASVSAWLTWPSYGRLRIESTPPGADITLNGSPTGRRTPATFGKLAPGVEQRAILTLDGFDPSTLATTLSENETRSVSATLVRQKRALRIESRPEGATVILNGEPLDGVTPLDTSPLTVGEKITLKLQKDDAVPHQSEFILEAGSEAQLIEVQLDSLYRDLIVQIEPKDAVLLADGAPLAGSSPFTLSGLIPNRAVRLSATKKGFESKSLTIVPDEQGEPLLIDLEPFTAVLRLEAEGLSAFVDGVASTLPVRLDNAQQGHHLIALAAGKNARLVMRISAGQVRDRLGRWVTQVQLNLDAQPWASVQIDNRTALTTPQSGISLKAGRHRLRFSLGDIATLHDVTIHVQ